MVEEPEVRMLAFLPARGYRLMGRWEHSGKDAARPRGCCGLEGMQVGWGDDAW